MSRNNNPVEDYGDEEEFVVHNMPCRYEGCNEYAVSMAVAFCPFHYRLTVARRRANADRLVWDEDNGPGFFREPTSIERKSRARVEASRLKKTGAQQGKL